MSTECLTTCCGCNTAECDYEKACLEWLLAEARYVALCWRGPRQEMVQELGRLQPTPVIRSPFPWEVEADA